MLWDIIKLYWQNRKEYKVIIIAPNHKDILVLDAVKNHINIQIKSYLDSTVIKQYDYVENTKIIENREPKIEGLTPDNFIFDELKD